MTHRSLSSTLLATLAALTVAACGSAGGDDPGDVYDDPVTANQKSTEDQCGKAHECRATWPLAPEMFVIFFGDNVTECIDVNQPDPVFEQNLLAAFEAGRTMFNPDNARACNEGTLALACDQVWTTPVPICEQVWTGTIADGGVCQVFAECVSQFCNPQTGLCETF